MGMKGQAAVTDALYFLLIVSFLSIFLFNFVNTYGNNLEEQINDQYNTNFANNALKTILYSSTPREAGGTIYGSLPDDAEIDYLLSLLKEDYFDDGKINDNEKKVLGETIASVLRPVEDNLDYIFYISAPEKEEYVFVYIHTTNFNKQDLGFGNFFQYSPGNPSHINYYCANNLQINYDDFTTKLNRLLVNVGPTSQASSTLKLIQKDAGSDPVNFNAQADLVLWDATWLGTTTERISGLLYADNPQQPLSDWDCNTLS